MPKIIREAWVPAAREYLEEHNLVIIEEQERAREEDE